MEIKVKVEINTIKDLKSILQEIRAMKEEYSMMSTLSLEVIVKY